jgi:hypothetical protein
LDDDWGKFLIPVSNEALVGLSLLHVGNTRDSTNVALGLLLVDEVAGEVIHRWNITQGVLLLLLLNLSGFVLIVFCCEVIEVNEVRRLGGS